MYDGSTRKAMSSEEKRHFVSPSCEGRARSLAEQRPRRVFKVGKAPVHYTAPMALKSTISRAELSIADIDRGYYCDHALTIARHPSETDERMMVRLLAFALHADEGLAFGRGLSTDDEPDLWQKDLTGAIELWIDVGQPDDKRIRRACGRARQVLVYSYGGQGAAIWWDQIAGKLERSANLGVISVPPAASQALATLARRTMQLNCTIEDGQVWLADAEQRVQVDLSVTKAPPAAGSSRT
jgi:uncharacterized protein YaeQ